MKKRIIALSVVSLLGLMGMSGCNEVTNYVVDGKDVIVTIGSGDNRENYTADELFGDYLNTSSGASAAFSAVYDVLVGRAVEDTQEITNYVDGKITDLQEQAESNAKSNNTNYKEELSTLLENENVDDLSEYGEKVKLSYKKEVFEEEYYESQLYDGTEYNEKSLHAEFIENDNPYHVRHILVKVSASGNSFFPTSETITSSEAKNLGNVIKNLASDSMTFGNVAEIYSEDSSASNYGSLNELMGRKTSYVNEFKFAVFGYDAYVNNYVTKGSESLGIPEKIDDTSTKDTYEDAIRFIPYSISNDLLNYAETTKDKNGENYKDGKEQFYPRNVIFNEFFSNHGLSFIEFEDSEIYNAESNPNGIKHFTTVTVKGTEHKVLSDENNRPILVTRAGTGSSDSGYQGIHFILIENSPLVNESKVNEAGYEYSLEEEIKYYSVNVPKTDDDVKDDKRYVTFINTDKHNYSDRAKEIESAVKSYDSNSQFSLYDYVIEELNKKGVDFTIDERIKDSINTYKTYKIANTKNSETETYKESWETYINLLKTQKEFDSYKIDYNDIKNVFGIK